LNRELVSYLWLLNVEFAKEIFFLAFAIQKHSEKINLFVELKRSYEKYLLLGELVEANEIIEKIRSHFGVSLWLLEQQIILAEKEGGLKKNKEVLNFIFQNSNNPFVTTIADFWSKRVEKKISQSNYNNKVDTFTKDFNTGLKDYIRFKINFLFDEYEFSDYSEIISYESIFSIVDKYCLFVRICQQIVSKQAKEHEKAIIDSLELISHSIIDPSLENIKAILFKNIPSNTPFDRQYLGVLDKYTSGKYIEVIEECSELIRVNPQEFSFLEILIKASLFAGKKIEEILIFSSILNQSILHIESILSKNLNATNALNSFQKEVNYLEGTNWGTEAFVFYKLNLSQTELSFWFRLKFLNSGVKNPINFKAFDTTELQKQYIASFNENSPTVNLLKLNAIGLNQWNDSLHNEVPLYRIKFYEAKSLTDNRIFNDAIVILEDLIKAYPTPVYFYEECLNILFRIYSETKNYDNYIKLYVETYFKNQNLLLKVNLGTIHINLQLHKFKNVESSIYLPIFYKVSNQNDHIVNVTVRLFLKKHYLDNPKDVINITQIETHLKVYFLYNVCTPEVLKYFTFFKGTKEILNARLEIFKSLITIDETGKDKYDEEISRLAQSLVILEGIKQVDESKIYVDQKGILLNELKDTKNNFFRYIEISDLVKKMSFYFIDIIYNRKILLNIPVKKYTDEELESRKLLKTSNLTYLKSYFMKYGTLFYSTTNTA
jgi:tetratricopeptide (TPR) repeat protein